MDRKRARALLRAAGSMTALVDRARQLLSWAAALSRNRLIRAAGYLLCFGLLADVAWRAARGLQLAALRPSALVGGAVLAVAAWSLLALGWAALSRGDASTVEALAVWTRTQLFRYIPGGVWGPAARARAAHDRLSRGVLLVAAENLLGLSLAGALGSTFLAVFVDPRWAAGTACGIAVLAVSAVLLPRRGLPLGHLAAATVRYAASFACYAGVAIAAQRAVGGPQPAIGAVAGAALVSWVAGVVVITAPGGLGAREAAYFAILADHPTGAHLAAAAVIARLAMLVAEVLVLAVAQRYRRALPAPAHGGERHRVPAVPAGALAVLGTAERGSEPAA